ncbi:MAG: flagellar basal body-associated FliL family protein [Anaeromyxobacter sp.]
MADADNDVAVVKGGGSKLVPILLALNLVLVAAVLGVFLMRGAGAPAPAAEAKAGEGHEAGEGEHGEGGGKGGEKPGPTTKLADFVIHLRDPEADRYARVSFEIEVATEQDKERFTAYMPKVRDAFISYLSDRTLEELRGSESIARTKQALTDRLIQLAPGVKIHALYVTDLVIQ